MESRALLYAPSYVYVHHPCPPPPPLAPTNVRSILDEARQVAAMCSDPGEADAILKSANEIEAMAAALVELRSQGQVSMLKDNVKC